jgi:hypothetical protein
VPSELIISTFTEICIHQVSISLIKYSVIYNYWSEDSSKWVALKESRRWNRSLPHKQLTVLKNSKISTNLTWRKLLIWNIYFHIVSIRK